MQRTAWHMFTCAWAWGLGEKWRGRFKWHCCVYCCPVLVCVCLIIVEISNIMLVAKRSLTHIVVQKNWKDRFLKKNLCRQHAFFLYQASLVLGVLYDFFVCTACVSKSYVILLCHPQQLLSFLFVFLHFFWYAPTACVFNLSYYLPFHQTNYDKMTIMVCVQVFILQDSIGMNDFFTLLYAKIMERERERERERECTSKEGVVVEGAEDRRGERYLYKLMFLHALCTTFSMCLIYWERKLCTGDQCIGLDHLLCWLE